jgi:hypothetical protein
MQAGPTKKGKKAKQQILGVVEALTTAPRVKVSPPPRGEAAKKAVVKAIKGIPDIKISRSKSNPEQFAIDTAQKVIRGARTVQEYIATPSPEAAHVPKPGHLAKPSSPISNKNVRPPKSVHVPPVSKVRIERPFDYNTSIQNVTTLQVPKNKKQDEAKAFLSSIVETGKGYLRQADQWYNKQFPTHVEQIKAKVSQRMQHVKRENMAFAADQRRYGKTLAKAISPKLSPKVSASVVSMEMPPKLGPTSTAPASDAPSSKNGNASSKNSGVKSKRVKPVLFKAQRGGESNKGPFLGPEPKHWQRSSKSRGISTYKPSGPETSNKDAQMATLYESRKGARDELKKDKPSAISQGIANLFGAKYTPGHRDQTTGEMTTSPHAKFHPKTEPVKAMRERRKRKEKGWSNTAFPK